MMEREAGKVERFFCTWGRIAWRKPMAMMTCVVVLGLLIASFKYDRDFQPNAAEVLKWFSTGIMVAAYGSSSFEAVYGKGPKKPGGDRHDERTEEQP